MNINKISENKINPHKPSVIKLKKTTPKKDNLSFEHNSPLPKNPKYYQAVNNVNFGSNLKYFASQKYNKQGEIIAVRIHIPMGDSDSADFHIDIDEGGELFLDKRNQINQEATLLFVELFSDLYKEKKAKYQKDKTYLEEVIEEESKNTSSIHAINPAFQVEKALKESEEKEGNEWLQSFISKIMDTEQKLIIAESLIENINYSIAQSSITTAQEAINIMLLSKTPNGFDLSDMTRKLDIAVKIASIAENKSYDVIKLITSQLQKEDGTADIDEIIKAMKLSGRFE